KNGRAQQGHPAFQDRFRLVVAGNPYERNQLVSNRDHTEDDGERAPQVFPEVLGPPEEEKPRQPHREKGHGRAVQRRDRYADALAVGADSPRVIRLKQLARSHRSQTAQQKPQVGSDRARAREERQDRDPDEQESHTKKSKGKNQK